jgi:hypothetical protein
MVLPLDLTYGHMVGPLHAWLKPFGAYTMLLHCFYS